MQDVEAKNRWTQAEGGCLRKVHLKSFNAQLAVDYPVYAMVICQVIDKLKLVLFFAAQYLTEWVKMTVIFISYDSLAQHSAASHQTQRWNSAVRSHLFEWIIACISIHFQSREREDSCVYLLAVSAHLCLQTINVTSKTAIYHLLAGNIM